LVNEAIWAAFSSLKAYPDPEYGELRRSLSHYHSIPIDFVIPGNGAAELLTWAARDLSQLPGGCLRLSPAFSDYDRALRAFACRAIDIPLLAAQSWRLDDWEAALLADPGDLSRCGLLLNNPHNPTGALMSRSRLRPLLARFGLVVVDEAFMDFLPAERAESVIDWVAEFPNLVVIRSLTKFYSMPGLRLGYAIAQPKTLQRWQQWRDPWSVNALAAAAGIAAIRDTDFQQQTWDWLTAANAELYEGLSALPGLSPLRSSANFFLVGCEVSATALQAQLLERHQIYIRDCMSFAELGDRYFRVAVKTTADHQRLLMALAEVLPDLAEADYAG
jgi:histidinol-phosphate/aromatic aminotransferase/cobyric acid decarboxylase-like protein